MRRLYWVAGKATPRLPLPCDGIIFGGSYGGSVVHQIGAVRLCLVVLSPRFRDGYLSTLPRRPGRTMFLSVEGTRGVEKQKRESRDITKGVIIKFQ